MPGWCNFFAGFNENRKAICPNKSLFHDMYLILLIFFFLFMKRPLKCIKWFEHDGGIKVNASSHGNNSILPLTDDGLVCKWFHITTLASTTVLDSTQINIGMWNVKQLSYATLIMVKYYQMKTENQSKKALYIRKLL